MKIDCKNIEIALNVFDVLKTIEEALVSIIKDGNNIFLLGDIRAGIESVASSVLNMNIENLVVQNDVRDKLKALCIDIENNKLDIKEYLIQLKKLSLVYQIFVIHFIFDVLARTEECTNEIAEKIFAFCDECPDQLKSNTSVLMWSCAMKIGEGLPMEAYKRTMQAFSMNPEIHKSISGVKATKYQSYPTQYHEDCPMCGKKGVPFYMAPQSLAINYEPIFQPAKLWMVCEKCNTLFAYNFPKLIQEDYVGCDSTDDREQLVPRYSLSVFGNILNNIQKYSNGSTLLEVGIGNGELAVTALEMGFKVEAVEISLKEAKKAREQLGLEVYCCDFMEFQEDKKYDVITMGDVLEHVTTPLKALEKTKKLLSPNGILWLSTPNYNSGFSRYHQFDDPMWREPWHFSYFSREVLLPYLERLGFTLLQYSVSERYNGSMELILRKEPG